MDLGLHGRSAIVLGASQGMGLAIAEGLAADGAGVAMFARRADVLEREAARIGGLAVAGDLTVLADLDRLVVATVERFGGVDVVVLNGGGPPPGAASAVTPDAVRAACRPPPRPARPPDRAVPPPPACQRPRPNHRHRVDVGEGADREPGPVERRPARRRRLAEDARPRSSGRRRSPSTRSHRAGSTPNGSCRSTARAARHPSCSPRFPPGDSARRRRSPPPCVFSHRTELRTSAARSSRSTAAF